MGILSAKGSLYATRPTLGTHIATPEALKETAEDLFTMVQMGRVRISVKQTYDLADAAKAHRDLEARATTGSTVMLTRFAERTIAANQTGSFD
jgi:NADPH2:quinone reductase